MPPKKRAGAPPPTGPESRRPSYLLYSGITQARAGCKLVPFAGATPGAELPRAADLALLTALEQVRQEQTRANEAERAAKEARNQVRRLEATNSNFRAALELKKAKVRVIGDGANASQRRSEAAKVLRIFMIGLLESNPARRELSADLC